MAASSVAGLAAGSAAAQAAAENQIYELRCYRLRNSKAGQFGRLTGFMESEHLPMSKRLGVVQGYFRVTLGEFTPRVYTVSAFDSLADMGEKMAAKRADKAWMKAAAEFGMHDDAPYDRVESWLLRAFDGMKTIEVPEEPAKRVFDLRIYEQETFRDTQEKMRMFNEEEIQIFRDCDINPVFFGETIMGSHMPSLIFMAHYADMDARARSWSPFGKSEGRSRIKNHLGWSNMGIFSTVSTIHLAGPLLSPIR